MGAPDHPHRGFETVTYMLEGEFEHEDSAGHRGALRAGDVQWMTAGAGIVHSEMPSRALRERGGRVHGFQVWVNLPARLQDDARRATRRSRRRHPDGRDRRRARARRVVAGEALGARAVIDTHTPIVYQDWSLEPGGDVTVPVAREHQALAYVFEGSVLSATRRRQRRADGQMALLGAGDSVRLRGAPGGGRLLLLAACRWASRSRATARS